MSLPPLECIYVSGEFVRECKSGNSSFKLRSSVPMLHFLYELCWTMVRGELPIQNCKAALEYVEFVDKSSEEQLGSCFADVVAQIAQDPTMPGDQRGRLIKLAKWLVESQLVVQRLFQERCEEEFLWEAEMVKIKAQDLKGKEVRVNTRLLYQQTKFNLLREESEGYAKLATLLCQGSAGSSQTASTATVGIIKSLIGHFDLDPNRVFDIVLECFELQPENSMFLDLIPIFPKSHASQILGFKFQYYQRLEINNLVPFGLYKLTALLVKEGFMDLDSIYAHLLPKDEEAFKHYNAFSAKRLEEANKIGKINLAATGKDLMEDEKQGDITIDLFTALDVETEAVAEWSTELENNQTLGLLCGFLSVDDWYHAHILFQRLAPLNPVAHIQICSGLFRLIEKSISSVYHIFCQTRFQSSISSTGENTDSADAMSSIANHRFIEFPKEVFEMLVTAGPYIYHDTLLLQKICRVLRGYYMSGLDLLRSSDVSSNQHVGGDINPRLHLKEVRARVEEALGACLLPSLQLVPANPAVGHEIWEVMSLLPFEVRYRLYGEWEKDDERNPLLLAARQVAKLDTRRILKRLAKENLKQLGRMVAKLAHANPMTVLRTIVHQIEAYREMITPVVDAFKYLTQLEYDILEYVVIERLAQSGRDKLKGDGLNLSDWLQSLASFWGHLCKKYPSMELRGLFQYLVNQLKRGQGIELVLLQELIQQMANVQYTENLTEDQLDAMAGSETLRYQATSFGVTRNNKALTKSTNRLRDALLPNDEPKLAIPLLLLIAQHRSVVLINADAPYIKMVSEQFDRCHGTLIQYVEFLCSAVTPASAYAQLVPSLDHLVHMYHLDPEVAFLIYRPVMRLFKFQQNSDVCWPLDIGEAANMETENSDSGPLEISSKLILDLGPPRKSTMWSDLLDTVKTMLPSKAWNSLSPDLYATFWGLTLYDLYVPRNRYESEISKQHAVLKTLEEVSDNSSSAIAKRKKEKERIQESLDRLNGELRKHEEHVASVHRRLSCEKDKWLSSCPDTLKINMEFLQRCIFPRCAFSMADAVYCAMFVHTLHSLGTPYFNTVNHIDVLICKTLQPMICCCTEYEAGRLGRFLYETLKIAYYWKSDESVYERECGNMPGFAVYYRYPNSQRVTYGQFIKVHWKWSQRITRLLIQCLESTEYMEIRNALIMLTKISGVFPVTRKTGINLEKRVAKIKSDEREDLKVLATGVAAALAARKPSWVTDEEFGMGFLELKAAPSNASKHGTQQNGSAVNASQGKSAEGGAVVNMNQHSEIGNSSKDQIARTRLADGRAEKTDGVSLSKSDHGHPKSKGGATSDLQSSLAGKFLENQKEMNESASRMLDEITAKVTLKSSEIETKASSKRGVLTVPMNKTSKQDLGKDDTKSGKTVGRASGSSATDKDLSSHNSESRQGGSTKGSSTGAAALAKVKDDCAEAFDASKPTSRIIHSPRHDAATSAKSGDRLQKRTNAAEDTERLGKRRKGDAEHKDHESESRLPERERSADPRVVGFDKTGADDQSVYRERGRSLDRLKEKASEGHDRDYRERIDIDKARDKSVERYGRERSVERGLDRSTTRSFDRSKDERNKDERTKQRYGDTPVEKSNSEDHFHSNSLPPPPPLPPNLVPQSLGAGRRDEDADRRVGASRHSQRLSPRHDERERRRSEENSSVSQDEGKRRREDDFRDRKRDEREVMMMKVEEREREREREREKALLKEDMEAAAASKRRKLKREHMSSVEPGEYSPVAHQSSSLSMAMPSSYDLRDGRDRKGSMIQHGGYLEEPGMRLQGKEVASKMARRENDMLYDREWEEEKRQRAEQKRRHRK